MRFSRPCNRLSLANMNPIRLLMSPALCALLTACSAHPGAANWRVAETTAVEVAAEFARIEVDFEGRATIFAETASGEAVSHELAGAARRCFWAGIDAQTIGMTCALATDSSIEEQFTLRVSGDGQQAELIRDDAVVGQYLRAE